MRSATSSSTAGSRAGAEAPRRAPPGLWVGTSGYAYTAWRGAFYPARHPPAQMLPWYAGRFRSVEINYTFRHLPTPAQIAAWRAQVPAGFRFTLKAPQSITHRARLRDCGPLLENFLDAARPLGAQLGAVLFQLPPNMRCDLPRFDAFLGMLPAGLDAAFEFRHPSWMCAEVEMRLRAHGRALCIADGEQVDAPLWRTADYAYFRLRDTTYDAAALERWAGRIRDLTRGCRAVYVYFRHEDTGTGPRFAYRLLESLLVTA